MSKIWQHTEDTCCGTLLNCETVAFQKMGHGLNWENLLSFIKVTQLYLSSYRPWVEAIPMKKAEQKDVIQFIKEQIIHRFGIPQSITIDQGTMFTGDEVTYFAKDYDIQLIRSTPFYAQENGQT